jgi:hypothetical protein
MRLPNENQPKTDRHMLQLKWSFNHRLETHTLRWTDSPNRRVVERSSKTRAGSAVCERLWHTLTHRRARRVPDHHRRVNPNFASNLRSHNNNPFPSSSSFTHSNRKTSPIMKFAASIVASLLIADRAAAFVTPGGASSFRYGNGSQQQHTKSKSSTNLYMAMDLPPVAPKATDLPIIQANPYGQPTEVRYSDFLKLIKADRIEKVTFSSDGTQLLGVDVDGARVKIEALPNDPDLLNDLTTHKVRILHCILRIVCYRWPCC